MHRLQIKILGLSEVRWPGTGTHRTKNGVLYYSGGGDPKHQYGVAVFISSELEKSVIDFIPLGERVMLLRLLTTHRVMNVVQAYAPTGDKSDEVVEDFYSTLEEAMKITKQGELIIVLGDFNAKIGKGADGEVCGDQGLGTRNTRGDRLVQFCTEHRLSAANTFFKQHPRRLYTWKSPVDRDGHIVRNQIDFVLIKSHLMKFVKSATTYPGADVKSDHNPVVINLQLRYFTRVQRPNKPKRIDVKKLVDPDIRAKATESLEARLQTINNYSDEDVEPRWTVLKKALLDTQEIDIGYVQASKKQQWMTDKILKLMNERRKYKTTDINRYRELNRAVRSECRKAKEGG
ncbi:craniofacial development protein 2-like [Cylas formicarius]|uniref:craniofacial development protein 2-like n=1 Tax=Cylas formicarius TaxID=197179 RepID=UPI0029586418|nr:craniofacial development protein 2-like [Cylas formicarius]